MAYCDANLPVVCNANISLRQLKLAARLPELNMIAVCKILARALIYLNLLADAAAALESKPILPTMMVRMKMKAASYQ